ncbi:MAG: thymidylate kinase [Candidatus Methanomethylophilaceae archaeon]
MVWYVVDGMDGCGKSTVARSIRTGLESKGRKVLIMEHPNRDTFVGRLERAFLEGDSKLHVMISTLLYIMDILHSLTFIRGGRGGSYDDIIFVRYSMAAAYLPDGMGRFAYDLICRVLPTPDVRILVDVDPDVAMSRIIDRGENLEIFETDEKLRTVRRRMLGLSEGWIVIDNSEGTEYMTEQVRRITEGT